MIIRFDTMGVQDVVVVRKLFGLETLGGFSTFRFSIATVKDNHTITPRLVKH